MKCWFFNLNDSPKFLFPPNSTIFNIDIEIKYLNVSLCNVFLWIDNSNVLQLTITEIIIANNPYVRDNDIDIQRT